MIRNKDILTREDVFEKKCQKSDNLMFIFSISTIGTMVTTIMYTPTHKSSNSEIRINGTDNTLAPFRKTCPSYQGIPKKKADFQGRLGFFFTVNLIDHVS